MSGRGLRRHLDDLVHGRRPRPFRATPAEADELRVALELRAGRPGADDPRPAFVDELHRRLAAELDGARADTSVAPQRSHPLDRRRLLAGGAGLAAASAAVGAAVGHALTGDRRPDGPDTVTPTGGAWRTVVAAAELPEGAVRAFDLGTVVGFVHRVDGVVRAVSGTCTHQGCRLRLDAARARLDCPCHTTSFAPSGALVTHQLPLAPPPLPGFATREVDGVVQVFAPPEP